MVQLLGSQGFWQNQVLRAVGGEGSRKYSALEGYENQYWPIRSSNLAWRTRLTEKPGRPQSTGPQGWTRPKRPCTRKRELFLFRLWQLWPSEG